MTGAALLAQIRSAQFQAAWYFSILVAAMVVLVGVGCAWAVRGGLRVYRTDRGAGAVILAASVFTTLALLGMLVAAAIGLVRTGGGG